MTILIASIDSLVTYIYISIKHTPPAFYINLPLFLVLVRIYFDCTLLSNKTSIFVVLVSYNYFKAFKILSNCMHTLLDKQYSGTTAAGET